MREWQVAWLGELEPPRYKAREPSESVPGMLTALHISRKRVMSAAFNMQTEIANLADRIVEPVAVKLAQKELDAVMDQICSTFAQLNTKRIVADEDFEATAVTILGPVKAKLSEAVFARIVDRLRGAMVGFCQRDDLKAHPDAEPWGLLAAGQRGTLIQQQTAQSEPASAEPWWSTSERAMLLLILLWLCTESGWHCTDGGGLSNAV